METLEGEDQGRGFFDLKQHNLKCPGTTEIVKVNAFKAACTSADLQLEHSSTSSLSDMALSEEMGITDDKLKEIQELCDPTQLIVSPTTSDSSPLKCINHPRRVIAYLEQDQNSSISYSNVCHEERHTKQSNQAEVTGKYVPLREVLLSVDIFQSTKQSKDQNFLVLASQQLTELLDKIICYNNYLSVEDVSDNPNRDQEDVSGVPPNVSKSAFFFISNTFYDDMRDPEAIRGSESILSWVEEGDRLARSAQLDHFHSVDMEGVTFGELDLRLGFPYLYSHHGNCEHLIIFRDMRLFNPKHDAVLVEDYPKLVFYARKKEQHVCRSCGLNGVWVTCDDELAPESPCFFCHDCFMKLHYTLDGKKLFQFKAYRYCAPIIPIL